MFAELGVLSSSIELQCSLSLVYLVVVSNSTELGVLSSSIELQCSLSLVYLVVVSNSSVR